LVGFVALSAAAAVMLTVAVMPAIAVTANAADSAVSTFNGLPEFLKIAPLDQTTTFYANRAGQPVPIATFYAENRVDVKWDDVNTYVKDAAVATEDPRFYQEGGIDLLGTIRGALSTASGRDVQGGSSITQQYVKNVLLQKCTKFRPSADATPKVQDTQQKKYEQCYEDAAGTTINRKLREMRYAVGVDKKYGKDQILLGYLNIAGYGGQIYGIEAAAEYYFGATAKTLTLPQAATLVGMVNNPSNLRIDQSASVNPGSNADNGYRTTLNRRNYVLSRMLANGKITQPQYDAAVKTPITPKITPKPSGCMSAAAFDAGFFCNYVQHIMLTDPAFGATADARQAALRQGGMQVYTTLNLDLQGAAQTALSTYIPPTDPRLDLGGTNVAVEVGTGRIVDMVENRKYNDGGSVVPGTTAINYATDIDQGGSAGFQTGSSFKAFDLAAWLEAGHSLYETVNANEHQFTDSQFHASCTNFANDKWPVSNDESTEGGNMTVLQATEMSVNTAFAMMGTKLDLCAVSDVAKSLLVHSASPDRNPWDIVPPMLLGTNYISPLTMATAYAAFGNNGVVCTPIALNKVIAANGTEIPVPKSTCTQGLAPNITAGVDYALQRVMTNGTATTANPRDGVPVLGKTGTTDGAHDNWLVTSTTKVATATWIGNIQGVPNARGVSQKVDMHNVYFRANGTGPAIRGNNVKFSVVKPILAALNAVYGGAAFPTPDNSLLYGSHYYRGPSGPSGPSKSNPPATPGAPAAPAVVPNAGNATNPAPRGRGRGKGGGHGG